MSHLDTLKQMQAEKDSDGLPKGVTITEDTVDPVKAKAAITDEPIVLVEPNQEKADLVVTSKADLEAIIKDIVKAYDVKIEAATNRVDQLALTIEMQEKKADVGKVEGSNVKVTPRSHNVPDHMSILADANKDKLKGKIGRFVNTRSDMRSLRRYQGYDPIIGADGKEVRYMDGVLMGITKERHKEEIQKPREERKRFRAESIGARFKEDAAKAGVEVIGEGIVYDKEYSIPSKT